MEIYILTLLIVIVVVLAGLTKRLRQPVVVSYVLAGATLSVLGLVSSSSLNFIKFLPDIGLAFLLFLVGMELDLREVRTLGKAVVVSGVTQIILGSALIYLLLLGFFGAVPILIPLVLSFSSTILVVKLLVEGKELTSLQGKLSVGVLLLEDIVAIGVLMFLAVSQTGEAFGALTILLTIVKGAILISLAIFLGHKILPRVISMFTESGEMLVLAAIAWCLLYVSLSLVFGFSLGIGAFLAGIGLAQSTYKIQITSKIKPLRDFFIMIFFINLGANLTLDALEKYWLVALVLSLYMVLAKPIIFFLSFAFQRFRVKTAFQAATHLSSVSEFSLIILFIAGKTGLVGTEIISMGVLTIIVSFVMSSFLINHNQKLYLLLRRFLKPLEREKLINFDFVPVEKEFSNHAILIGCHRSGEVVLKSLKRIFGDNVLVVDFNPDIIKGLKDQGVYCLYGDISDQEVIEKVNLKPAKLVVSTIRDLSDNLLLLESLEKVQSSAVAIITAADTNEAIKLYERGAHHVTVPVNLEGNSIGRLISDYHDHWQELVRDRERKLGELKRTQN